MLLSGQVFSKDLDKCVFSITVIYNNIWDPKRQTEAVHESAKRETGGITHSKTGDHYLIIALHCIAFITTFVTCS